MIRRVVGDPIVELCRLAGIDANQVYSIVIDPHEMVIGYYLHNDDGQKYLIPDTECIAAATQRFDIDWSPR